MANQLPFKFPDRYSYTGERLSGGQGYVYICNDSDLERDVAVKVVSAPNDLNALRQELAVLAAIRSAHVAEIYDLLEAQSGKHIGLVEQYVSGSHLSELVGKCTHDGFMNTVYQICRGVHDIHAINRVHRDLKPNNIRFDQEGVLKILDFGISRELEEEGQTTHGKGTHPYIAPELYTLPASYTKAVDVYAIGVIAHELAFGKLEQCLKTTPPQVSGSPKKFSSSSLGIGPEICDLLDRALNSKPAKRPKSADLKDALERRIVFGRHRATIRSGNKSTLLGETHKSAELKSHDCSLTIVYDGLRFTVASISGNVDINNISAQVGQELPSSCVVTMNTNSGTRDFITVDMSHPGIIL